MAKRQTRRTVSLAWVEFERLTSYAKDVGVSAAALTEFALSRIVTAPLDRDAFDAWRRQHVAEVATRAPDARRAVGATVPRPSSRPPMPSEERAYAPMVDGDRERWREIIQRRMRGRGQPKSKSKVGTDAVR